MANKITDANELKMIYIHKYGDNSVQGTILNMYGLDYLNNLINYTWMIGVNDQNDYDKIVDECRVLKIKEYIIFDFNQTRRSSDVNLW